jgi:hypothetical protein
MTCLIHLLPTPTKMLVPYSLQHTPLPLPLAIPQVAPDYDQPYFRGYNEILVQSGIAMNDWLKFLDALNIAMVTSLTQTL